MENSKSRWDGNGKNGELIQCDKRALYFFFALSCVTLATAVIAGVCGLLFQVACPAWLHGVADLLSADAIKNIAMTVGLTGVIFTWLLQIIGDQECGLPMDKLFRHAFKPYTAQLVLFMIALLLSIGFSSLTRGSDWDLIISGCAFISSLAGIFGMWFLCRLFLFSTQKRRYIAFSCLEEDLLDGADARRTALNKWRKELPLCIQNGDIERDYVLRFFRRLSEPLGEADCTQRSRSVWYQIGVPLMLPLVQSTNPFFREAIPTYIALACEKDGKTEEKTAIPLLALYAVGLAELFPEERSGRAAWSDDIYRYIWHYFAENKAAAGCLRAADFCVYCALAAVLNTFQTSENRYTSAQNLVAEYAYQVRGLSDNMKAYTFIAVREAICLPDAPTKWDHMWQQIMRDYDALCAQATP